VRDLEMDVERLDQELGRMSEKAARLERDIERARFERAALDAAAMRERARRDEAIGELKRALSKVVQRENLCLVEMKKKEAMYSKLQDRLHGLLSNKSSVKKAAMVKSRPLSQTANDSGAEGQDPLSEFIENISTNYRVRNSLLLEENDRLRQTLDRVQRELYATVNGLKTPNRPRGESPEGSERDRSGGSEISQAPSPARLTSTESFDSVDRGLDRKISSLRQQLSAKFKHVAPGTT